MYSNMRIRTAIGVLVAALIFAPMPDANAGSLTLRMPGVSGDTSSDGAVIMVALFATACVVMLLIGLKADYENVFTREATPPPVHAGDVAVEELRQITASLDDNGHVAMLEEPAAGIGVAWHVKF